MPARRRFGRLPIALTGIAVAIAFGVLVRPAEVPLAALRVKYASPTSRFLRLDDGGLIHVRDEGARDGPVLLLIPGLHSPLQVWEPWVARLGDALRLVSIDLPGQGLSDAWPRDDYSVAALDSLVTEVTRAMGIGRFSVGGHSMSGGLAWRYALAHRERVEKIILVAAGGIVVDGAGPILAFRILASPLSGPLARQLMLRPLVRANLERAFANDALVTQAMVERYFETINGEGHRATLGKRLGYLLGYEPIDRLDGVSVPTLILWGEDDRLRPVVYARIFHERIRGSVLRVYPAVGHFPMEEAADATAGDVRRFMTGEPGAATGGAAAGPVRTRGETRAASRAP
jgi:pimeloyl-ACP methyl ester carboxylesterase